MAQGRLRSQWDQVSFAAAVTINSTPFRKGKPVKPADLNPYAPRDNGSDKPPKAPIDVLRKFVPKPTPPKKPKGK